MPDTTYIACPRCGEPYAMSAMQKRLFHGRTLTCQRCAKPFTITEETPDPVPAPAVQERSGAALADAPDESAPRLPRRSARPARPGEGISAGRMAVLVLLLLGVLSVLLYVAISPAVHRSREAARRLSCQSNLAQVGLALQLYANMHGGRFPDHLDALVLNGSLPAELLVCPSSGDTAAPGKSPVEQALNLANGPHQSYIYVGKGMRFGTAGQVLAYEPLDHHDGEGVHVLYSDGSVQFLSRAAAGSAIPQLATPGAAPAGTQPATSPAGG